MHHKCLEVNGFINLILFKIFVSILGQFIWFTFVSLYLHSFLYACELTLSPWTLAELRLLKSGVSMSVHHLMIAHWFLLQALIDWTNVFVFLQVGKVLMILEVTLVLHHLLEVVPERINAVLLLFVVLALEKLLELLRRVSHNVMHLWGQVSAFWLKSFGLEVEHVLIDWTFWCFKHWNLVVDDFLDSTSHVDLVKIRF